MPVIVISASHRLLHLILVICFIIPILQMRKWGTKALKLFPQSLCLVSFGARIECRCSNSRASAFTHDMCVCMCLHMCAICIYVTPCHSRSPARWLWQPTLAGSPVLYTATWYWLWSFFSLMSFLLKGCSFPGTPNSSASCHLEAPSRCSLLYSSEREVELELFPTAFWELRASWLSPSGQGQTHYLCRFFILKTLTISIPSFKMVCAHVTCQDCPLLAWGSI